jgi:MFS family permease
MIVPGVDTGRGRARTEAEPDRRPVTGVARRRALRRTGAFWLVAGVLFLLLFVSVAASPLYDVYQAQWRFSATTLTAIFGVYVLAFLVTLLVFGSVSDYLGRRGVIEVALVAGAGACGLFLAAHGAGLLFAARALSGVSAGAATSAGGAALVDLSLGPSLAAQVLGSPDLLGGGLVIFLVTGTGAAATVTFGVSVGHGSRAGRRTR